MSKGRVFILNTRSASSACQEDLKELFTANKIFDSVDVTMSNFDINYDGLKTSDNVTFVIGGGSALGIMAEISGKFKKNSFHFFGSCAGAYAASAQSDMFRITYELDDTAMPKFTSPIKALHLTEMHLDIFSDYKAIGPFIPNSTYLFHEPKSELGKLFTYLPYCTQLKFNNITLPQLYVAGCGFEPISSVDAKKTASEVVATYADQTYYSFFDPESLRKTEIKDMPACIRRIAKPEEKQGGAIAFGTHPEVCVTNSHFLRLFRPDSAEKPRMKSIDKEHVMPLSMREYKKIEDSREESLKTVVSVIQETFKCK